MKRLSILFSVCFGFMSVSQAQSHCGKYLGSSFTQNFEAIYEFLESKNSVFVYETRVQSLKKETLIKDRWVNESLPLQQPHSIGAIHIENSHRGKTVFLKFSEMTYKEFMNNGELTVAHFFRPVFTLAPGLPQTKGVKTSRNFKVDRVSENEIVVKDFILNEMGAEQAMKETVEIRLRKDPGGKLIQTVEYEMQALQEGVRSGERYKVVTENLPVENKDIMKEILDIYFMTDNRDSTTLQ